MNSAHWMRLYWPSGMAVSCWLAVERPSGSDRPDERVAGAFAEIQFVRRVRGNHRDDHDFLTAPADENSAPMREPSRQTCLQLATVPSPSIASSKRSGIAAPGGTRMHAPVLETLRTAQSMSFGSPTALILPVRKVKDRLLFLLSRMVGSCQPAGINQPSSADFRS